jgi:hypothetical protein
MCDLDTRANFIAWYREVFGFTIPAASTLYDVQLAKDKDTLSKLDNGSIDNICHTIH